ncbi:Protein LiaF [Thermoflexales bacterium]|nr:Protein LiaF [Thermoflexales bacterium]
MQHRSQLFLGGLLVLLGLAFLLANLLQISVWAICFPTSLIFIGVLLLVRPAVFGAVSTSNWHLFGDIKREGEWAVVDEDLWLFFGDARLDLTRAQLPLGETNIRLNGLIGDVNLIVPPEIGVLVVASGVIIDLRTPTDKVERFLSPVRSASPNYATAERKLHVSTTFLIGDIDVLQR